jgi:hypothetical protein
MDRRFRVAVKRGRPRCRPTVCGGPYRAPTTAYAVWRIPAQGCHGTFPEEFRSRPRVSNPEPAVYKTAALPIELGRRDELNAT